MTILGFQINAKISEGSKDELVDGEYNSMVKLVNGGLNAGITFKLNMGQVICVNKVEMYFEPGSETVSLDFMCESEQCTCGGKESAVMCKEYKSVAVSSAEALPGDLPEKTDCTYGDTVTFSSYSTTPSLSFLELTLTGYQPKGEYIMAMSSLALSSLPNAKAYCLTFMALSEFLISATFYA